MKDNLNGAYRVKWYSSAFGEKGGMFLFTESRRDYLMLEFKKICNRIINYIASEGHLATVEETEANNGVIIIERWPNDLTIMRMHLVWIAKED